MLIRILKILLPIIILVAGLGIFMALVASRPKPEPQVPEPVIPLVRVVVVTHQEIPMTVQARGTVVPRTETTLAAQVAAQVISVSRSFEVGGFFEAGDVLVTLDSRDFELATEAGRARVAQAELRLAQQEAEARVAKQEWEQLGVGDPDPLVLREPQIAEAQAALAAARAELQKAELDYERTRIRAPFAGRVRDKSVDLGQYVTPGQSVATIHAIDFAEIRLPIPHRELAFLEMPVRYRDGAATEGPFALIEADFTGQRNSWPSRIVRTEGEVDEQTRMIYLVARVEDPYGAHAGRPPLAMGVFVEALIQGVTIENGVLLPREALRSQGSSSQQSQVLVVDDEDMIRFQPVEVIRYQGQDAIISGESLAPGERVCISQLDVVVDGMRVQTTEVEGPIVQAQSEAFDELFDLSEPLEAPHTEMELPPPAVAVEEKPVAAEEEPVVVEEEPVEKPAVEEAEPLGTNGDYFEESETQAAFLLGVEVVTEEPLTIEARLQGDFAYQHFRVEEDASRIVVDLNGVVSLAEGSPLRFPGAAGVRQVRFSQHQVTPEPWTRLVIDLDNVLLEPEIERTALGMRVIFR